MIRNLIIFSPSLLKKDDEFSQIVYYYPNSSSKNLQISTLGLCQTILSFSLNFLSSNTCIVNTSDSRSIYFIPEPDFHIVLEIGNSKCSDAILKNILVKSYTRFALFNRKFADCLDISLQHLTETVYDFYSSFLSQLDISSLDILSSLNGFSYFPLRRQSHISISTFINSIESRYPKSVGTISILYKHHLIWCGFDEIKDFIDLYDYITDPNTGKISDSVINQVKLKDEAVISTRQMNLDSIVKTTFIKALFSRNKNALFSGYLVGPLDFENRHIPTRIYIGKQLDPHGLIVYQFSQTITIIVTIPNDILPSNEFYKDFVSYLSDRLPPIYDMIRFDQLQSQKVGDLLDSSYRYITHNSTSNVTRTSIGCFKTTSVEKNVVDVLNDAEEILDKGAIEVGYKLNNDTWVHGIKDLGRERYSILPKFDVNIDQVEVEIQKLFKTV